MMLHFFYQTVLPLSLAGSVTMLLLLALTPVVKRLNSTWQYYIRFVAVVLFLVPFSFSLPTPQAHNTTTAAPVETLYAVSAFLDTAAVQPPVRQSTTPLQLLALVWVVGAVLFALYKLFVWLRFHWLVKQSSVPVTDQETLGLLEVCKMHKDIRRPVRLAVCPRIGSPMLLGILHPVILLPRNIPKQELRLVLLHELTHSKRCDLPYKLAVLVVGTVHWFNPFAHLLARQVTELCELSCDEAVVRRMSSNERKAYGLTILSQIDLALCKAPDVSSSFSGGKQHLKRRLHLIMNASKNKKQLLVLGVCVVVALSTTGVIAASALNSGKPAPTPVSSLRMGAHTLPSAETMPNYGNQTASSMPYREGSEDTQQADLPVYDPDGELLEQDPKTLEESLTLLENNLSKTKTDEQVSAIKAQIQQIEAKQEQAQAETEILKKAGSTTSPEELAALLEEYKAVKEPSDEVKLATAQIDWIKPLDGPVIAELWAYFGHTGTDIQADEGTAIYAAADGTVLSANTEPYSYGNHVILSHGDGISTLYGHCKELLVEEGDVVKQGDQIATVGRSGNASYYHCHFELRDSGTYLDARNYMD